MSSKKDTKYYVEVTELKMGSIFLTKDEQAVTGVHRALDALFTDDELSVKQLEKNLDKAKAKIRESSPPLVVIKQPAKMADGKLKLEVLHMTRADRTADYIIPLDWPNSQDGEHKNDTPESPWGYAMLGDFNNWLVGDPERRMKIVPYKPIELKLDPNAKCTVCVPVECTLQMRDADHTGCTSAL